MISRFGMKSSVKRKPLKRSMSIRDQQFHRYKKFKMLLRNEQNTDIREKYEEHLKERNLQLRSKV